MNRPKLVALLIAGTALIAGCASQNTTQISNTTQPAPAAVRAPVVELSTVDQFATTLNADVGVPRLLLLMSPT